MAKETVEAVRQAELDAVKLEREAALKKDAILQKASEDAKLLILSSTKEALAKASKDLKEAASSFFAIISIVIVILQSIIKLSSNGRGEYHE